MADGDPTRVTTKPLEDWMGVFGLYLADFQIKVRIGLYKTAKPYGFNNDDLVRSR